MNEPAAQEKKRVWPLFTVAVLSFVPFLGIFFGGAGATWGLISSRPRALWAALIAFTGALLNIAAIVVFGMSTMGTSGAMTESGRQLTQAELLKVVVALEDFHAKEHAYPPSLQVLQRRMMLSRVVPTMDMSAGPLHLPHEYRYVLAPDGESYDLFATGPDNVAGTADDIHPALPDSIRARSGYRPQAVGAHP